jgi:hypothetical protein
MLAAKMPELAKAVATLITKLQLFKITTKETQLMVTAALVATLATKTPLLFNAARFPKKI